MRHRLEEAQRHAPWQTGIVQGHRMNNDDLFASLPNKPMLRIDQVAEFFGITKRTVYNWYPEQLQGTQINGVTLIYRQSVIDLVLKNNGKKKNDEIPETIDRKIKNRRVISEGL